MGGTGGIDGVEQSTAIDWMPLVGDTLPLSTLLSLRLSSPCSALGSASQTSCQTSWCYPCFLASAIWQPNLHPLKELTEWLEGEEEAEQPYASETADAL